MVALLQLHLQKTLLPRQGSSFSKPLVPFSLSPTATEPSLRFKTLLSPAQVHGAPRIHQPFLSSQNQFICRMSRSDMLSQLELEKPGDKPVKRVNGIFWIILVNLGLYVADHLFQVRAIKTLYLYHNWPCWYQFLTATFCHADWNHLSSNLFFLYIFGKLVEEEEGNLALWFCYVLTGAGANLVSWLLLPRNSVSVGASGAVFGLFAISVLVKMSWDWRKILEVLILGQFVIKRVMEAAQASTGMSAGMRGSHLQSINHVAHLSGALIGVLLVWLVSKVPSDPSNPPPRDFSKKKLDTK